MNLARARRRWGRWDRYVHRIARLDRNTLVPRGADRALDEWAAWHVRKRERQARRDAHFVVGAVLDAYLKPAGGRR